MSGAEPGRAESRRSPSLVDLRLAAPELLLEPRYATSHNFTGAPIDGYRAPRLLLRPEAAEALRRVARRLKDEGLRLKVFDGYRPSRATRAMVVWAETHGHAQWVERGYIARTSQHNLGLAVDVTLVDGSGREVDMGTPFDAFVPAAHTASAAGAVLARRRQLERAMVAEGFRPLAEEWWHFSFSVAGASPIDLPILEGSP